MCDRGGEPNAVARGRCTLFRARVVNGATVYWVEGDVAEFVRTLM